jgi:hypothetical protein
MTRVRVLEEPRVVWGGSSSGTYANSAQAIVRNVGRAKAKKVRVELILPGGAIAVLKGPAFLMPNQKAVYTWKSKELVVGIGRVIPKTDCENCYR